MQNLHRIFIYIANEYIVLRCDEAQHVKKKKTLEIGKQLIDPGSDRLSLGWWSISQYLAICPKVIIADGIYF